MSSRAIWARWTGSRSAQSAGGNVRRPGGGTADQAQGLGEGDPIRVEVGGRGGLRGQRADRVMDDQVGPDLLMHQVGQPRAQHPTGAAQVGLELVVAGLVLPPLVVGRGQLVGPSPVLAGGCKMLVSRTISSPVPLPSRSGTSYSTTRARCTTGRPRSSNASGTVLMSDRSWPTR